MSHIRKVLDSNHDMDGGYAKGFRLIGRETDKDDRRERVFTLLYNSGNNKLSTTGRYEARTPALAASKAYTQVCRARREQRAFELAVKDYPELTTTMWNNAKKRSDDFHQTFNEYLNKVGDCQPEVITIRETTSEMDGGRIVRSNRKGDGSHREYQYYIYREALDSVPGLNSKTVYREGETMRYNYRNKVIPIKAGDKSPQDAIDRHMKRSRTAKKVTAALKSVNRSGLRGRQRRSDD